MTKHLGVDPSLTSLTSLDTKKGGETEAGAEGQRALVEALRVALLQHAQFLLRELVGALRDQSLLYNRSLRAPQPRTLGITYRRNPRAARATCAFLVCPAESSRIGHSVENIL